MKQTKQKTWNIAGAWAGFALRGSLLVALCQIAVTALAQPITKDVLHGYVGQVLGPSLFSTDTPSGKSGDYSIDFGVSGNGTSVFVTNAAFLNAASSNDVISFSFWLKRYWTPAEDAAGGHPNSSSSIWVDSPSSSSTARGINAHTPWSDDTLYFDTSGCCDGTAQRISSSISGFGPWGAIGTDDWWNEWHHFVYIKSGPADKEIWIDAQLFLLGSSTNPLPADLDKMWFGGGPAGSMNGIMDDVAWYATALATNGVAGDDITNLFNGVLPTALPASDKLLAYWNFDDAPPVTISPVVGTPLGFSFTANTLGTNTINSKSIVLTLNGVTVPPTSVVASSPTNQYGDLYPQTLITYTLTNPPFVSGATEIATLSLSTAGGFATSISNSFVVPAFATLTSAMALPVSQVQTNQPGFYIATYAVDFVIPTATSAIDQTFAGAYGPNVANLTGTNAAGYFVWTNNTPLAADLASGSPTTVNPAYINFDAVNVGAGDSDFNEPPFNVYGFPGIPSGASVNSPTADFAVRVYTAIYFTNAGLYTLGVNSDDNFELFTGPNPFDVVHSIELGSVTGGRGEADTDMAFYVTQPGYYGFLLGYDQIGGGASLEFFSVDSSGNRVLVNDITNSLTGYLWLPQITASYITTQLPTPNSTGNSPTATLEAAITDGANAVATNSISLTLNGSSVPATITKSNGVSTVIYTPSTLAAPFSTNTVTLIFKDGSAEVTNSWSYVVGLYTKDKLTSAIGVFQGVATYSTNSGGHTGKAGDYSLEVGDGNPGDLVIPNGAFANIATSNDCLSVSFWIYKYDIQAGSAFWFVSPSSGGRGYQSHVPWSDDNIYFDTSGCCDGAAQRISAGISTFAPYTAVGNDTWWNQWHFFVYSKNGAADKEIWIDGQLFLQGSSTDPLPTDITSIYLGADYTDGDYMHGKIDDFAIYTNSLVNNGVDSGVVSNLFSGMLPTALAATNGLLAYWDFNDAPTGTTPPPGITLTAALSGGNLLLSYPSTPTGFSLVATTNLVGGTWVSITNVPVTTSGTSVVTLPAPALNWFFRLKN